MGSIELSLAELRARPGAKWHHYPDDVLPAWIAEMDFDIAEPIHGVLRRIVGEGAYGYEDPSLYPSLAQAFADYMRERYAWDANPELTLPVADLVQAQFTTVAAFTDPGEKVILQTPIYPPFINAVREMGRQVVDHPLRDDGTRFVLDAASLRDLVDPGTPLLMLCNPHNPTGRVFERGELEALAEVALERQLIVLADEVHADLTYAGMVHIPFASLGPDVAERTITITSATKTYNIPGVRCGIMHFGSAALRERFSRRHPERLRGKVNRFGVEATIAAWRAPECRPWLEQVMQLLEHNRERVARFIATELPAVRYYSPDASYLAWLDCRALELPGSPQQFFLEHARVALTDGTDFAAPGRGHVRLNFGTSAPILDEVLGRLAESVRVRRPAG
jgi:cystathionine beta-lyase